MNAKTIATPALLSLLAAISGCSTLLMSPPVSSPPVSSPPVSSPPVSSPPQVPVSTLVAQVQKAVDPFWTPKADSGLPRLASVELELQTVRDNRKGLEFDYLIAAVRGYYGNSTTEEVNITLSPPTKGEKRHFQALSRIPDVTKSLREAIASAQRTVKATYGSGSHVLATREVDVEIRFAVTADTSIGANGWKISPISLGASDESSRSMSDTIIVTFRND